MQFTSGDWRIDVLIQGYPGKSTQHGGLGWSTVALLRGHGRIVVLDGGGYGMRKPLVEALAKHGVKLSDVTDLLVSHLHHDHVVNWPGRLVWVGGRQPYQNMRWKRSAAGRPCN